MVDYREILRLTDMGFSQRKIMQSCGVAQKTVVKVQRIARKHHLSWEQVSAMTNAELKDKFFSESVSATSTKRMPDYEHVRKELLRNNVTKKLLWTEYLEECRQSGDEPLMYSQFCYYIQKDEEKRRATMHIDRKPGEQIEVDWAGDRAHLIDPYTGEQTEAHIFVGVLSYSQFAYVEAFPDEKTGSWIRAHVHMYQYFGGVSKILVPDNCKTAVIRNRYRDDPRLNQVYYEMAEHYGTAIIPARVRKPKDKPNAEGTVGNISTWIIAALRNEQFFTLPEMNQAIRVKLDAFNRRPFQKKEGNRYELFTHEEKPFLAKLPAAPYELADWKQATVQFNYHISVDGMLYSVPYSYIKKKVDVRVTETTVEVFFNQERIASHRKLHGRKGQYSTVAEHMPSDHQEYLEWSGDRFRRWAKMIGDHTFQVIDGILTSKRVEQQGYRSCMGVLKLAKKYSSAGLENACEKALRYTSSPSYKSIQNILAADAASAKAEDDNESTPSARGITRGADYYRR